MDKLKAEVERKFRRQAETILAEARREAEGIVKAAQREAMDKAKMLEKAKATREARKAQKAAAQAEAVTQPEGPQAVQVGPEVAPWNEPGNQSQQATKCAIGGSDQSDQGDLCSAIDAGSQPPW